MSMMNKKNILQILPYFPPHVWWVEKVWEEIFLKWIFWKSSIFSGNMCQQSIVYNDKVDTKKKFFFPSIDIVDNFPFPRLWTFSFWKTLTEVRKKLKTEETIIITHTRFFFSSFLWWVLAKIYKKKWIHIEHGSDYVKLSSPIKNKIAYIYDRCIWKWIFKRADRILAISEACKKFIENEFWNTNVTVWYRGIEFQERNKSHIGALQAKFPNKTIIGYIGRLYKWKNVEGLCEAFISLPWDIKNNIQLVVIGGGEELDKLRSLYEKKGVYFTWTLDFLESYSLQWDFDIHVHPSSPWWGLATTLLQAMNHGCMIVATPNEWAKEVIEDSHNGFLLKNDSVEELRNGMIQAYTNLEKKEEFAMKNKTILQESFDIEKNILKLYNLL